MISYLIAWVLFIFDLSGVLALLAIIWALGKENPDYAGRAVMIVIFTTPINLISYYVLERFDTGIMTIGFSIFFQLLALLPIFVIYLLYKKLKEMGTVQEVLFDEIKKVQQLLEEKDLNEDTKQ